MGQDMSVAKDCQVWVVEGKPWVAHELRQAALWNPGRNGCLCKAVLAWLLETLEALEKPTCGGARRS